MASVSAYKVYRTTCCHDVFDEPMYASFNAETVFRTLDPTVDCLREKNHAKSELEFVGFMRRSINDLRLMGLADIEIPSFVSKK